MIHLTHHKEGFKLFKKTAWNVFEGQSSSKKTHELDNQVMFDLSGNYTLFSDKDCYKIKDIANYLQLQFKGKEDVPLETIWKVLETHPVFPSDGFRRQIKKILKTEYRAVERKGKMSFSDKDLINEES